MKKYLKLDALTKAEVPRELDLRILAAGKLRQGALLQRRRKLRFVFSGAAAAAAFAVALGLCLMPQNQDFRDVSREEYAKLAALSDWTSVEQENYNLSGEIFWGSTSVTELADNRTSPGV
ncbi:MAG: hypothetical protein IKC65_03210 [Lentisphaeria bacterium]|nr:hypothetical protein [Lentisphaeria bacterium]